MHAYTVYILNINKYAGCLPFGWALPVFQIKVPHKSSMAETNIHVCLKESCQHVFSLYQIAVRDKYHNSSRPQMCVYYAGAE
jgi:hypothetical protein